MTASKSWANPFDVALMDRGTVPWQRVKNPFQLQRRGDKTRRVESSVHVLKQQFVMLSRTHGIYVDDCEGKTALYSNSFKRENGSNVQQIPRFD